MKLEAEVRAKSGRRGCHQLRKKGYYPAVVYGREQPSEMIQVSQSVMDAFSRGHAVRTKPFDLTYGKTSLSVLVKNIQRDSASQQIEHIDFYVVEKNKPITLAVPLRLVNTEEAKGVVDGGVVEHALHEVEVKALPKNIPSSIEVDIIELEVGGSLSLGDVKMPKGCELAKAIEEDYNPTVVSVKAPRAEEPEEPQEAEGEEAVESDTPAETEAPEASSEAEES